MQPVTALQFPQERGPGEQGSECELSRCLGPVARTPERLAGPAIFHHCAFDLPLTDPSMHLSSFFQLPSERQYLYAHARVSCRNCAFGDIVAVPGVIRA